MPFCPKAGKKQCINRMIVKTIFEDTINEYSELIDMDTAENMQRMYYRGIAELDSDGSRALSLLIWELQSVDSPGDTTSELKFIYAADPSCISSLLKDYQQEAMDEDVKKTVFEMKSLDNDRQAALKECGFTLTPAESRDIEVTLKDCLGLPIARRKAFPRQKGGSGHLRRTGRVRNEKWSFFAVIGLLYCLFKYIELPKRGYLYLVIFFLAPTPRYRSLRPTSAGTLPSFFCSLRFCISVKHRKSISIRSCCGLLPPAFRCSSCISSSAAF